jgi:hypothetical protein
MFVYSRLKKNPICIFLIAMANFYNVLAMALFLCGITMAGIQKSEFSINEC